MVGPVLARFLCWLPVLLLVLVAGGSDFSLAVATARAELHEPDVAVVWPDDSPGLGRLAPERHADDASSVVRDEAVAVLAGPDDVLTPCPDPQPGSWLMTDPWGMTFREAGEQVRLTARLHYQTGASEPIALDCGVFFQSSAPQFVTVDPNGLLQAVAHGKCLVRVHYRGLEAEIVFNLRARSQALACEGEDVAQGQIAPRMVRRPDGVEVVVNRVLVKLAGDYTQERAVAVACRRGGVVAREFEIISWFLMAYEANSLADLEEMLVNLKADPDVDAAGPEQVASAAW